MNYGPLVWALNPGILIYLVDTRCTFKGFWDPRKKHKGQYWGPILLTVDMNSLPHTSWEPMGDQTPQKRRVASHLKSFFLEKAICGSRTESAAVAPGLGSARPERFPRLLRQRRCKPLRSAHLLPSRCGLPTRLPKEIHISCSSFSLAQNYAWTCASLSAHRFKHI